MLRYNMLKVIIITLNYKVGNNLLTLRITITSYHENQTIYVEAMLIIYSDDQRKSRNKIKICRLNNHIYLPHYVFSQS